MSGPTTCSGRSASDIPASFAWFEHSERNGAQFAAMSGSGSAVFGLLPTGLPRSGRRRP